MYNRIGNKLNSKLKEMRKESFEKYFSNLGNGASVYGSSARGTRRGGFFTRTLKNMYRKVLEPGVFVNRGPVGDLGDSPFSGL